MMTLCDPLCYKPTRFFCPWDFPGRDDGVGCHFLLQGIFQTQGSKPSLLHLLHWQTDSLLLSHLSSPERLWGDIIPLTTKTNLFILVHFVVCSAKTNRWPISDVTENYWTILQMRVKGVTLSSQEEYLFSSFKYIPGQFKVKVNDPVECWIPLMLKAPISFPHLSCASRVQFRSKNL